jgi:hypothetical protein
MDDGQADEAQQPEDDQSLDAERPATPDADRPAAGTDPEQPDAAQAGDNAPLGGDEGTQDQLTADNAVEEDMLKALDPDAAPG